MIFVFSALALYLEEEMEGCEGCGEDVAVSHLLLPITPDCSSDPGSRDPDCPSLGLSLIYYLDIYLPSTLKALRHRLLQSIDISWLLWF